MCGRFSLVSPTRIAALFPQFRMPAQSWPRYNIAPTNDVLAVRNTSKHRIESLRWGLIPNWMQQPPQSVLVNARAETLAEKPAYRDALRRRRALVFADGFFEWKQSARGKQPIWFSLASGEPFAFAALWDSWQPPNALAPVQTCTIITTEPNALVAEVHDRMPVMLQPSAFDLWLANEELPAHVTSAICAPYRADAMTARPVSAKVNSTRYDAPDIFEKAEEEQAPQLTLF